MDEEERAKILSPITKSIAEQKPTLSNLMNLLKPHTENKDIEKLIRKLKDLEKAYEKVTYEEVGENVSSSKGTTTIGNETNVVITPKSLAQITLIISNIRNSIADKSNS